MAFEERSGWRKVYPLDQHVLPKISTPTRRREQRECTSVAVTIRSDLIGF
jgi:hypothetical protein